MLPKIVRRDAVEDCASRCGKHDGQQPDDVVELTFLGKIDPVKASPCSCIKRACRDGPPQELSLIRGMSTERRAGPNVRSDVNGDI